jgi:hypothetical protein
MTSINKVIHPLDIKLSGYKTFCGVFMKIEFKDGRLSISGVVGPQASGNARGGCGQIDMDFRDSTYSKVKLFPHMILTKTSYHTQFGNEEYENKEDIRFSSGWNLSQFKKLLDVWDKWHLNDMQAGCVHQRAMGWDKELINPDLPAEQKNMKCWEYPPIGYLTGVCPECGYKYGSAWLFEEVPADVIEWLNSLPNTDKTPAWI